MNKAAFDGLTRELGQVATRRSVFSLLAGAAAMSAGLVLGDGGESLARGKRSATARRSRTRAGTSRRRGRRARRSPSATRTRPAP